MTIVGTGSQQAHLSRLADAQGIKGVTFCGFVAHEELPHIYSQHDIFVNASREDNFPGSLVEAACCGLPIVTTRAGGIPDMIRHGETGLVVNLDDHQALAAAVIQLLQGQDLARQLSHTARRWVEQYSWAETLLRLRNLYDLETPSLRVDRAESMGLSLPRNEQHPQKGIAPAAH